MLEDRTSLSKIRKYHVIMPSIAGKNPSKSQAMLYAAKISGIIFYCFTASLAQESNDTTLIKYNVTSESKAYISQSNNKYGNSILFSTCRDSEFPRILDCDIKVKILSNEGKSRIQSCHLDQTIDKGKYLKIETFPIILDFLGAIEKVVIAWHEIDEVHQEEINLKIVIADMPTCIFKPLEFPHISDFLLNNFAVQKDLLHVFLTERVENSKFAIVKRTYNARGELVEEPQRIDNLMEPRETKHVYAIDSGRNERTFFLAEWKIYHTLEGTMIKFVGPKNISKDLDFSSSPYATEPAPQISTSHGVFSICGLRASKANFKGSDKKSAIICNWFDLESYAPKSRRTTQYLQNVTALAVHNLERDAMLLLRFEFDPKSMQGNLIADGYMNGFNTTEIDIIKDNFNFEREENLQSPTVAITKEGDRICYHLSFVLELENQNGRMSSVVESYKKCVDAYPWIW